ncbi:MAG: hypothetical protein WCD70_07105 [Alphaproteobacteria bacterium]
MKIKNGYIWSEKLGRWRKLPRDVWRRMQWERAIELERKKQAQRKKP